MRITKLIDDKLEVIQSKKIFSISLVILVGLVFRVYFTPWELPTSSSDSFILMIEGLSYSTGDFSNFNYRFLWPGFLSIFFEIFRFDDYFGYMTIVRIISIGVSLTTIPILYLVSKEFVKEKYAIIATVLFTIDSNLVENSIFGQTEPLFILFGLTSFYFILQKNFKCQLLAFIFAGLSLDIRINGIVLFLLLIFALSIKIKHKEEYLKTLIIGVALFLTISTPAYILYPAIHNEEILPFLSTVIITILDGQTHYSTYESSTNVSSEEIILNGIKNEILHIFRISIPYLILFFPIGIIVSFKNIDFKKKMLFAVIIISLIIAIPQYTVSNEFRNLFFLTPFLCIFSVIGIQKLTENIEIRNLFLILFIAGLILLSANFLRERYDIDKEYFVEKDNFGKYIVNNFEGNITGNMRLEIIRNMPNLKVDSVHYNDKLAFYEPGITMDSISQLIKYSKENDINYLIIDEPKFQKHFPIFNQILIDKNTYEYLEEVLDSRNLGYKKLNVKIFKINWEHYNEL